MRLGYAVDVLGQLPWLQQATVSTGETLIRMALLFLIEPEHTFLG